MIPSSVLIIQNGTSKVVNVREQDGVSKIIDMVPDLVNKFTKGNKNNEDLSDNTAEKVKDAFESTDGTK